jgi:hypothetical protein
MHTGKMERVKVEKCCYFPLCLDETTNKPDVTQPLTFVRTVQSDFSTQEELLNLCTLKGTTMGIGIYEAVKTNVDKFGGWISALV